MENIIFYFTGTGNSLVVARDIADNLGDTEIASISDAIRENAINLHYKRIGFVFPVYYCCLPLIVERFIKKLKFAHSHYVFGVVTFGGSYGMVLSELSRVIREQGGTLNAGFSVRMPGNYIDKYNAWSPVLQRALFKREKKKTKDISIKVQDMKSTHIPKKRMTSLVLSKSVRKILADFGNRAGNFHVTDKCNGCGICEQVCPDRNIRMNNNRPQWGNICEHCVACIQWCPKQAIEYADKTGKRKRYQHPEIKISDMILRACAKSQT